MSTTLDITHSEVQQIRQAALFEGTVSRDQAHRLAQSWLEQHQALACVRDVHAPLDAIHETTGRRRQVCAGCGTDAGNWQIWPCPTIRAIESAALAESGGPR